jgi:hypothetical protein
MRNGSLGRAAGLVPALLVAAVASAQQIPPRLPASASPPPEIQRAQEAQARTEQAQKERRALPATPTPPPQQQEIDKLRQQLPEQAATPPTPPSREEILQKLRELPGGAERLEEAKRRGARIPDRPSPPTSWRGRVVEVLAWLNPLHVETAQAQTPSYSVSLTAANPYVSTPFAFIGFSGVEVWCQNCRSLFPQGTALTDRAYAYVGINVPANGWYILNFSGWGWNSKALLAHWSASGWQSVATWDFSSQTATAGVYLAYPALLELGAGTHYFILRATQGTMAFNSFQAYNLP